MFSFFKRKYAIVPADMSALKIDMHSHLLPGIDDGSPDLETSNYLKKGLEDLGFSGFITTPHIIWDIYKNTNETIGYAIQKLHQEGQTNIRAAAEHYMDDHFNEMVKNKQPLLPINGRQILVEFSFVAPPLDLKEQLFNLFIAGYQPILAHPERYTYFASNKSVFDEFKNMGCLFQINLLSLIGYYGKVPQETANYLVAKKYVDYAGTDLHHEKHLQTLRQSKELGNLLKKLVDNCNLLNASLAV